MRRSRGPAARAVRPALLTIAIAVSLFAVSVVALIPSQAVRADDSRGRAPVEVSDEVEAATHGGQRVPVMVMLDDRSASGESIGSPSARRNAERVAATLRSGAVGDASPIGDLPMLSASVDAAGVDALRRTEGVRDVVPNRRHRVDLAQSVPRIGAPTAWAAGSDGSGQVIAVLDTGVDSAHAFLSGKVVAEGCFSSNIGGSTPICPGTDPTTSTAPGAGAPCTTVSVCYHGTHVAGIAAGGAGGSFSGAAPGAQLIAVQVFSAGFTTSACAPDPVPCITAWESDIVRGLDYVFGLRNTFDLAAVNISLGGPPITANCANEPEMSLIAQLRSAGIPTVVASGNESDKASLSAPACVPGAVSVGSTSDLTDVVSGFSNSSPALSLLAPGSSIVSSVPSGTVGSSACPAPFAAATCAGAQGTSMAAPHVSAAFAIARHTRPTASVTDNLNLLRSTGLPVIDNANGISTPRIKLDAVARPPTFHPLPPSRVLDTRDGTGGVSPAPLGNNATMHLTMVGRGGIPSSGVSSVVLNVTYVNPSSVSFVTVWPFGVPRPLASNLNLDPGATRANLITTALGQGGRVSVFNNTGTTHLVADIAGYYDDGGVHDDGARYRARTPARQFDTRDGTGGVPVEPLGPGETLTIDAATLCGFAGATAVALNVTALDASESTHVTAWPAGEPKPVASNLNLGHAQTVPNLAYVKLGQASQVSFFNNSGSINLFADIQGCFDDGSSASGRFVPITPARVLDTRDGTGASGTLPVGPGATIEVAVTGVGGVPSSGVLAVVLNVTATEPTAPSHVTVWPAGESLPIASNLNFVAGQTVPNLVVVPVGAGGLISLANSSGSTHLLADVAGWYLA